MFSFKRSLIALIALLVIVGALATPLAPAAAAPEDKEKGPRKFYLAPTLNNGSEALSACAAGYHMASLWEILDPSNLRYNTELGLTTDDAGSGPPSNSSGWVRTGNGASGSNTAGFGNCLGYTSSDASYYGTIVRLPVLDWTLPASVVSPWDAMSFVCHHRREVWCVQD